MSDTYSPAHFTAKASQHTKNCTLRKLAQDLQPLPPFPFCAITLSLSPFLFSSRFNICAKGGKGEERDAAMQNGRRATSRGRKTFLHGLTFLRIFLTEGKWGGGCKYLIKAKKSKARIWTASGKSNSSCSTRHTYLR